MTTFRLALLSALIFLAIFAARYAMIDPHLYAVRDDGVITMSVGRNLAEFGFVGVNPSGPIVEASSSPVQMLIYAGAFAVTGIGYAEFALVQTLVAAACLGALFPLFLRTLAPLRLLAFGAGTATLLTLIYPFFLWHGSGMENAVTHVLIMTVFAALVSMSANGRIHYGWLIPFVLLPFVRFELLLTTLWLLSLLSLWWAWRWRSTAGVVFSAIACGLIALGHTVRIVYFGSFFPNTKVAQSISLTDRITGLVTGDGQFWQVGTDILTLQLVLAGWLCGVLGLALLAVFREKDEDTLLIAAAAGTLLIAAGLPFVLGPARIDVMRTMTYGSLVSVLVLAVAVARGLDRTPMQKIAMAVVSVAMIGVVLSQSRPYYLGWHTEDFAETREIFLDFATEHDIARPLVANPDLGVMSWPKTLNVVDFGKLGTPAMAALSGTTAIGDYVLDLTRPDILEIHHPWLQRYCDAIFLDPRFEERYAPLNSETTASAMCGAVTDEKHYWVRKSILRNASSRERLFLDRLQESPSQTVIETELARCSPEDDCSHVVRTVYRLIPELRENGAFDAVVALFDAPLERAYLEGWRSWQADALLITSYLNENSGVAGGPD